MQITMFDGTKRFKIDKPIRLISLFSGYDSQFFSLKYLGANVKSWRTCEWAIKSIQALKDAHFKDDNTDYSQGLSDWGIFEQLYKCGISANYNEPMTYEQIKRLGIVKARQIFSNIIATRNMVNIQQVHAEDLGIEETDKYCYVMTYSFPCQDLSLAGKGAGMEKGSGTRSGMLWEVERILDELSGYIPHRHKPINPRIHSMTPYVDWYQKADTTKLPQVLLMENVPEVIGTNNIKHFAKWLEKLESLGYHCYWQVLNAKDYGVPQNRERCFMVSVLGDYYYEFPRPIKLEHRLKDLLEDEVDEKYYLSDRIVNYYQNHSKDAEKQGNGFRFAPIENCDVVAKTITTRAGSRMDDNFIKITNGKTKVIKNLKTKLCNELIKSNRVQEYDVIRHSYSTSRMENMYIQNQTNHDCSPTLDTRCDCLGVVKDYRIRKLTPKECFRLMGVKDQDFENIAQNQSNASLYHLAGDSIVVDVLMEIFKQML